MTTNSDQREAIIDNASDLSLQPRYRMAANLDQVLIAVTEDKVRLELRDFAQAIDKQDAWQTPGAISLTVCLSLATSSFHPWLFPADTWHAIFVVVLVICVALTLQLAYKYRRRISVEDVISNLRGPSDATAVSAAIPGGEPL